MYINLKSVYFFNRQIRNFIFFIKKSKKIDFLYIVNYLLLLFKRKIIKIIKMVIL